MLYVAAKCETHPRFGSTKLNKVLFYADFLAYHTWGKPITGAEYRRRPYGPAPTRLLPVQKGLESAGAAVVRGNVLPNGMAQQRLIPLRSASLEIFEPREIALIDGVIEKLKDLSAEEVSDKSHTFPGWAFAEQNETIPYFTVLLMGQIPPLSSKDSTWVKSVASRRRQTA